MSTDLPYAADTQVSLSYDELEVCVLLIPFICITQHSAGRSSNYNERAHPVARHRPDHVQLHTGPREKPQPRAWKSRIGRNEEEWGSNQERKHICLMAHAIPQVALKSLKSASRSRWSSSSSGSGHRPCSPTQIPSHVRCRGRA